METLKTIVVVLIVLCGIASAVVPSNIFKLSQHPKLSNALSLELKQDAGKKTQYDVLLFLEDKVNIDDYMSIKNVDLRARLLTFNLIKKASESQKALLSMIAKRKLSNVHVSSYWISNSIAIENCPVDLLAELTSHNAIGRIHSNKPFKSFIRNEYEISLRTMAEFSAQIQNEILSNSSSVEWNVDWVEATKLWQKGYKGAGITVGVADTGVAYQHPALLEHYRGYDAATKQSNHNYNWWDAIRKPVSGGSKCGYDLKNPCDDYGHGTHCAGTAVGGTADRGIGVAPEAKWIGCRNMDAGNGRPSTYIDCLQFMMAPTDLDGKNPDPSKRPHIVSNSYGCEPSEHCEPNSLKDATDAIVAAGVFMSVAAGNSGPSCSSASSGPGIYESSYTVGALGFKTNKIAGFSSRGPVTSDKSNRRKPDISAPGSGIVSSWPPNSYTSLSGTSMATPHVAGCVALLWNAVPSLARDIAKTEFIINKSAFNLTSTECNSMQVPNNVFGYGGIQIEKAYELAQ